jgi:hypothetical protein
MEAVQEPAVEKSIKETSGSYHADVSEIMQRDVAFLTSKSVFPMQLEMMTREIQRYCL